MDCGLHIFKWFVLKKHIDASLMVFKPAEKKTDLKSYGVNKHNVLLDGLFTLVKLLTSANNNVFNIFPCHI